ncbi:MAG: ADOP family duplicated permease [Gemmatimonadetes bacterium]|nr:ADOP family duplicated permease [Gemmatimonadota bacterium]MDA1103546.1 ADOP family duplicated permease [Gemmatimonadota bacterium]
MPESGPPRLASWVLERRLPAEIGEAVSGDLEHEYRRRTVPGRARLLADLWFWAQVIALRSGSLRRAARRLSAARPSYERNHPGRAARVDSDLWSKILMNPHDLKYAFRRLIRTPGFTAVAVLSLALGIGANTAMFSVVNAVLLRGLPVSNPSELVEVYTSDSDGYVYATSSLPDYLDLKPGLDGIFNGVVGTRNFITRVEAEGGDELVMGELVSGDYFEVLGVPMALGRGFLSEEDATPGTHPVVILGHAEWVTRYGSDPGVIGRTVRLSQLLYTVVGVAHEDFTGSMPVLVAGYYVPLMMTDVVMGRDSNGQIERRSSRSMFMKARLAPGISVEQANAALAAFSNALAEEYPESNENRVMTAMPRGDVSIHPFVDRVLTPVAGLLLGVVGLVLLIACANLASFLLARAEDRRKEIAVRLALGAGRWTLIRQLLTETMMLALMGGVAGLWIANWTVELMMAFQPPLPVPVDFDVSLDANVLMFTLGVSTLAGLMFGLAPALQATNPDVAPTLKGDAGRTGKRGRFNLRNILVIAQVGFSFVLLIGAGLFVRSLQKAQQIDPGFDTGPAAMIWPDTDLSGGMGEDERRLFFAAFEERLLADPAIDRVTMADRLPLGAAIQTNSFILPGVPSDTPDGDHDIDVATVTPSYFETMGVAIVRGEPFDAATVEGEPVIIVSEAFVSRYYPGENVVGRTIDRGEQSVRIVGVASDTKVRTLGEAPRPYVYDLQGQGEFIGMQVVVKGSGTSAELLSAARRVLREVDPNMAVIEAKTMNEHLSLLLFPPRMAALLLTVFGGLALLLAAIGIYGVVSYAVSKRTRELGIRMSLGASANDVVQMAIGGGMRLVVIGALVGLVLAAGVTWALSGFLYGIGPNDIVTFVTIPVLLSGVALVAAWVPARRASLVDPVRALRSE